MLLFLLRLCILWAFFSITLQNAQAAQWQVLNGTTRYKVSYDKQSVHQTQPGRLEIWLRFIPRGETDLKFAATNYKDKRYRSHQEHYEIDCSDRTALLGEIDLFGTSKTRLKQLRGGTEFDPILPGSVLDSAAQYICPALDNVVDNDEAIEVNELNTESTEDNTTLNSEKLLQIENLLKETTSKEATAETWKLLGNIYFDTDQPEQAIKAYERSLVLHPDDTDILNDLGAMYRQSGNFQRAVINFEKAYSIDPTNLESLYNSGYVYAFDLNNISKALVLWRKYLELETKNDQAHQIQSFIEQYGK